MISTIWFGQLELMKAMGELYMNRTLELIEQGIPNGMVSNEDKARSASRDAINRASYLSPEVDHIWGRMSRLIGETDSMRLHDIMSSQEVETSY